MAIVFFIIIFFVLLTLVVVFSTIKVRIEKLNISNKETKKIQYDYLINIELYFLNKIKIVKITLNPEKIKKLNKKLNIKQKLNNIDLKKDLPDKKEVKKVVEKISIKLEEFHLFLEFGTIDVILTSGVIAILASFLGIVLAKFIDYYESSKYQYKIMPIYKNKNTIKLSLNCIIQVKVVHIISIIFTLVRNRKEKKKYERTSNRGSYDYSYE